MASHSQKHLPCAYIQQPKGCSKGKDCLRSHDVASFPFMMGKSRPGHVGRKDATSAFPFVDRDRLAESSMKAIRVMEEKESRVGVASNIDDIDDMDTATDGDRTNTTGTFGTFGDEDIFGNDLKDIDDDDYDDHAPSAAERAEGGQKIRPCIKCGSVEPRPAHHQACRLCFRTGDIETKQTKQFKLSDNIRREMEVHIPGTLRGEVGRKILEKREHALDEFPFRVENSFSKPISSSQFPTRLNLFKPRFQTGVSDIGDIGDVCLSAYRAYTPSQDKHSSTVGIRSGGPGAIATFKEWSNPCVDHSDDW